MAAMSPIKDKNILESMKGHLKDQSTRNYLIFRVGLNLGLSVQDLLRIKIEDVLDKEIFGRDEKYGIRISPSLQKEIKDYVGERKEGFLFLSSRGKPLSRFQLYGILKGVARDAGFKGDVGSITLRKTFAYWAYKNRLIYLPLLSKYLNHHTVQYTLRYIDIEEEESQVYLAAVDL